MAKKIIMSNYNVTFMDRGRSDLGKICFLKLHTDNQEIITAADFLNGPLAKHSNIAN